MLPFQEILALEMFVWWVRMGVVALLGRREGRKTGGLSDDNDDGMVAACSKKKNRRRAGTQAGGYLSELLPWAHLCRGTWRPSPANAVMTQSAGIFHSFLSRGRRATATGKVPVQSPFLPALDPTSYGSSHGAFSPAGERVAVRDRDDLMSPGRSRPETAPLVPLPERERCRCEMLMPGTAVIVFLTVTSPGVHIL